MRKVEENLLQKIYEYRYTDTRGTHWKEGNTELYRVKDESPGSMIYLHEKPIAFIPDKSCHEILVTLAGHDTRTTHSRIRAILGYYTDARMERIKKIPCINGKEIGVDDWVMIARKTA